MNGIRNNPVLLEDIRVMQEIYGDYNVYALKGKTKENDSSSSEEAGSD